MKKTLNFKTNTLLKNLVGKDLINDDNIAIVELVKNAYDAGSEKVEVRFEGLTEDGIVSDESKIVVADKGSGMDLSDIEDKWLNIAYSEKIITPQESGAYLAGNKGIGRFSCDRLGERLDLLTRVAGGRLLHLAINWPDFEVEGEKDLTIQQIDLEVRDIKESAAATMAGLERFPDHGTALIITKLRSNWDRDGLLELKRALEKILNPNQLFLRNRFRLALFAPDLKHGDQKKEYSERVNGEVKNQVFDKLQFNSTYITGRVTNDGKIETELYHEGEPVFKLVERNDLYRTLKEVNVVIYYLSQYKKAYFKRQTGFRSVEFGSIFLFLNGFRIAPYGDRGDDWLGLDVRKAQGTRRFLSSRDIVGRVEVQDNEDRFKPISSREGLKNTDAFDELKKGLFLDTLKRLEKFVVEGLGWDSVPENIKTELNKLDGLDWKSTKEKYTESWERKKQRIVLSLITMIGSSPERIIKFWFNPSLLQDVYQSRTEDVKKLLAEIEGLDPAQVDNNLKKSLSNFRKLIAEKEEEASEAKQEASTLRIAVARQGQRIKKLEDEKETYQAQTFFLQQVTDVDKNDLLAFHHQIYHESSIVSNYLARASRALTGQGEEKHKEIMRFLEKATLATKKIAAITQFATKANFRAGMRKEITDFGAFVEQYVLHVAKDFVATSIRTSVVNNLSEAFDVRASRIELSMLIDNLISNADKADAKNLIVTLSKVGKNTLRVSFVDDGNGLSKKLPSIESMFEMGVTTTPGSGLGLYHAKQIVEGIGGVIMAKPKAPKGMEFIVEVTR